MIHIAICNQSFMQNIIHTTIIKSNLTCHEAHRSNKDFEAMDNFH